MSSLMPASVMVGEWFDAPASPANDRLAAALTYAARGWPVFPVTVQKVPLTEHGRDDGSANPATIKSWWRRWPNALVSIVTGEPSGIVAVDVDIKNGGSGIDSLDDLGITTHPTTPTSHTPSGGYHMLFAHPGIEIRNSTGRVGPLLDIRGDGGGLILPPGPGRFWDPILGLDTPLAALPEWAIVKTKPKPEPQQQERQARPGANLSRYATSALDSAATRIIAAPAGEQETTINGEAYSIGQLAGGGVIPAGVALEGLLWAAHQMASFDPRRPWRPAEVERKVKSAFTDGLRQPRTVPNAR